MPTPADIKALSSGGDFDDLTDEFINIKIEEAKLLVNKSAWRARYEAGVRNLAAHLITIAMAGGGGGLGPSGEVLEESGAGLSRKYGSSGVKKEDAPYLSTPFGSVYLMLKRAIVSTPTTPIYPAVKY